MNMIEALWLDYCWDVVNPNGSIATHRSECELLGGTYDQGSWRPEDATLRFPGYLGADYSSGRVLIAGAVHNGNVLFAPEFRPVETAAAEWRAAGRGRATDDAFLSEARRGYEASIPTWGPWKGRFGDVLLHLRLGLQQVAYTNVAKCWSKPRKTAEISGDQDELLMQFCLVENCYPIGALVAMLQPLQVYASALNVHDSVTKWSSWGIPLERVWRFNSNSGALLQAAGGGESIEAAAAQYRALRAAAP